MKRFFKYVIVPFLILLLCQDVSASQTQTEPSNNSNVPTFMAEKQHSTDKHPEHRQKQTDMKDDGVIGDQSPALVESVKQLAKKTNWALLISGFAALFAGLSWLSTKKSLEVTHNATKAEFQPYISVPQSIVFNVITPEKGRKNHTLVVYTDSLEIENIGKTSASLVNISAQGKFYKDRRHFDEQATVSNLKTGDMTPKETWYFGVRFEFDFPDGDAFHYQRIREMDIYITVTFKDMFAGDGTRKYIFHYLVEEIGFGAELQSGEEKTDG